MTATTFETLVGISNPFDTTDASAWVIALGGVLFILYYALQHKFGTSKSMQRAPPIIPGGAFSIFPKFFSHDGPFYLMRLSRRVAKVFELPIAPPGSRFIVVCCPHLGREILDDPQATKWKTGYSFFDMVCGGDNLFSAEGHRYKHARKSTATAFARPHLPRMNTIVHRLVNEWTDEMIKNDGKPSKTDTFVVDVSEEMQKVTIRTICEVGFEHQLCDRDMLKALRSLQIAYREFAQRTPQNPFRQMAGFLFAEVREARRAGKVLQDLCQAMLDDYRLKHQKTSRGSKSDDDDDEHDNGTGSPEVVHTVLRTIVYDDSYKNDGERVRDMVTYLAGGYDTASYTISWTLLMLAKQPQTQRWLREELRKLPPAERPFGCQALKWVIRESMRLHPVVAMGVIRNTSRDMVYDPNRGGRNGINGGSVGASSIVIPKRSIALIPFLAIHRDGEIFENPDEFIPRRWESPTADMSKAWLAFGSGRRNCPGQALANIELCVMLAKLCSDYEWTIEDEGHVEYYVTLKTVDTTLKAKKIV